MLVAGAEETPAGSTSENRQPARRCAGCEPSGRGRDGGRRLNWVRWQGRPHASAAGRDAVRPSSTRHALRAQRERGILRSEVRSEVRGQEERAKGTGRQPHHLVSPRSMYIAQASRGTLASAPEARAGACKDQFGQEARTHLITWCHASCRRHHHAAPADF
jgi:hypothetical protein